MTKTTDKREDNSIGAVIHQGKSIAEWQKLLQKEFNLTQEQVLSLVRHGVDLGRMLQGLDEDAADFNNPVFKDEQFFFETGKEIDEAVHQPEDVVTIGDLISLLRRNASLDDKLMLRVGKKMALLFNVDSKGGTTVVDIIPAKDSSEQLDEKDIVNESLTYEQWSEAADWFNSNGYDIEDDEVRQEQFAPQLDQFLFKAGKSPTGKDEVISGQKGWQLYQSLKDGHLNENVELAVEQTSDDFMTVNDLMRIGSDAYPHNKDGWMTDNIVGIVNGKTIDFTKIWYFRPEEYPSNGIFYLSDGTEASHDAYEKNKALMAEKESLNEGRGWYGGGYGGTGRSWKSLGGSGPRGAEIGWFKVEELDPKAKGKMPGWRCGPSNFKINDLLYPERNYKVGTMMMRNKYVKAGSESGIVEIAVPSYFDAVNNNDEAALAVLSALKIPLDLTFGMDPKDDYTVTYAVKS